MIIITPKPTKTDLIRYILDYWDPCRKIETSGPMFYNYEAEIVSNSVRKNSKLPSITRVITEVINEKLKTEGCDWTADEENAKRIAESIISAVFEN